MNASVQTVGQHLREWRQRRRMSQLELACEAEVSSRHLSFLETGRAKPSREMVLHLCERLTVPLRDRNTLLLAAGYAPVFPKRPLEDPALEGARNAVDLVLAGHEPYPALAIDRHWNLVTANKAIPPLLEGADPELLTPPINVLRLSLHPKGLASRIVNLREWREHLLTRLRQQIDLTADPVLIQLQQELAAYPQLIRITERGQVTAPKYGGIVVPLQLQTKVGLLSLFSTTTVFGTPIDVTLSELAIEAFFPADADTGERLGRLCGVRPDSER